MSEEFPDRDEEQGQVPVDGAGRIDRAQPENLPSAVGMGVERQMLIDRVAKKLKPILIQFAESKLRPRDKYRAEEFVEEAIDELIKAEQIVFADRGHVRGQLFWFINRCIINYYRLRQNDFESSMVSFDQSSSPSTKQSHHDPSVELLHHERQKMVDKVLSVLRGKDREILILHFFREFKHVEIAEHFGITVEVSAQRVCRAAKRFRKKWIGLGYPADWMIGP